MIKYPNQMFYIKFPIEANKFHSNLLQNCRNSNLQTPFRGRIYSTYIPCRKDNGKNNCFYLAYKSNSTNLIRRLDIKATHYAWLLLPIKKKLAAIGYYTFTSFTSLLVWLIARLTNTFIVGIFFNGDAYLKKKNNFMWAALFFVHWDIVCNFYLWDDIIKWRKKHISIAAYLFIDI